MRHIVIFLLCTATVLKQGAELDRFSVDPATYLAHVRSLSSDKLGGRGNGTPGLRRAADYIAAEFKKAELHGGGDSGSYFQTIVPSPPVTNVVGVLSGSDRVLAGEAIVIGAHYDHLGLGAHSSMDPQGKGIIHNGADDNASGTAMVIEMAHAAARARATFRRSIVFAAFAGEELDLRGSRHYVTHQPGSVRKTVAMINLDMVGRARGRVMIGGTGLGDGFQKIVEDLRPLTKLRLDDFREGYGAGASDNDPFERQQVPTLLFFTGFHEDYHRPTDDWERIDAQGGAEIARLALAITARIANADP